MAEKQSLGFIGIGLEGSPVVLLTRTAPPDQTCEPSPDQTCASPTTVACQLNKFKIGN